MFFFNEFIFAFILERPFALLDFTVRNLLAVSRRHDFSHVPSGTSQSGYWLECGHLPSLLGWKNTRTKGRLRR